MQERAIIAACNLQKKILLQKKTLYKLLTHGRWFEVSLWSVFLVHHDQQKTEDYVGPKLAQTPIDGTSWEPDSYSLATTE